MRLHIWNEDYPPTVHFDEEDEYIKLLDYPHWVGYEVGDQVQFLTGHRTIVFFVIEVEPEYAEYDHDRERANVVLLESMTA